MGLNGLDAGLFPRAAAYLDQLPLGLNSHPQCTSRTDVARIVLGEFPALLAKGVSLGLRGALQDAVLQKDTFPDAWAALLRLMFRDRGFTDDATFLRWHFDVSARVFATPLYRMMMHVLSPTLVLAGAQRRWNSYRTGTHLSSEGTKDGARLRLEFPAGLYTELLARSFAESYRAALVAAKAQGVDINLSAFSATEARYTLSWR